MSPGGVCARLKWNLPPLTRRDAAASAPLAAPDLDGEPAFLTPPVLPASAGGEFCL